jgi:hypothetical protein
MKKPTWAISTIRRYHLAQQPSELLGKACHDAIRAETDREPHKNVTAD